MIDVRMLKMQIGNAVDVYLSCQSNGEHLNAIAGSIEWEPEICTMMAGPKSDEFNLSPLATGIFGPDEKLRVPFAKPYAFYNESAVFTRGKFGGLLMGLGPMQHSKGALLGMFRFLINDEKNFNIEQIKFSDDPVKWSASNTGYDLLEIRKGYEPW